MTLILHRSLLTTILLNFWLLSFGQQYGGGTRWVRSGALDSTFQTEIQVPLWGPYLSKVNEDTALPFESFGLRFVPERDQNIYLTYCVNVKFADSKMELAVSINNQMVMNLKYSKMLQLAGNRVSR